MKLQTTNNTNRYRWLFSIAMIVVIFLSTEALAQNPANGIEASGLEVSEDARIVVVEPDNFPVEIGNLNETIEQEIDENTIFVLQRDAVYWTDRFIENENHRLHIRAEEGDGHPPIIRSTIDITGESTYNIRGVQDVIIEGVYFIGINENGVLERIIRFAGQNSTFVFDNGYMTGNHDIHIWVDNTDNRFYITNSVITNVGRNENDQQGRLLDTRGNDQEVIYIENNTLYNLGHAFFRNSGGVTQHMHINHNTLMNLTQYARVGEVQEMYFTNNLFTNVYTIGEAEDEMIRAFIEIREQPAGMDESERVLVFRNNNVSPLDQPFVDLIEERNTYDEENVILPPPVLSRQYMDPENEYPLVDYENNIYERVQFADEPPIDGYVDWTLRWMQNRVPGFPGDIMEEYDHPMFYDRWEDASDDPAPGHFTVDLLRDFTYTDDYESYTAAENGFPLGDLNWFPELKEAWIETGEIPTSVEEPGELATEFRIVGNYPNPFNPTTNIIYDLASQADVKVEVFNVIGQRVDVMDIGTQSPGRHEVTFDAQNLSSGVYMVRMQMGSEVQTINISLIK